VVAAEEVFQAPLARLLWIGVGDAAAPFGAVLLPLRVPFAKYGAQNLEHFYCNFNFL
jgi:hypothetical protein